MPPGELRCICECYRRRRRRRRQTPATVTSLAPLHYIRSLLTHSSQRPGFFCTTLCTHFSLCATSTCCMSSMTSGIHEIISRCMSDDVTDSASNIFSTNSCEHQSTTASVPTPAVQPPAWVGQSVASACLSAL